MDSTRWRSAEAGDGRSRTGQVNKGPVVSATGVTDAEGMSEGGVAEGGEPSGSARRAVQAAWSRSGAVDRLDVQRASR